MISFSQAESWSFWQALPGYSESTRSTTRPNINLAYKSSDTFSCLSHSIQTAEHNPRQKGNMVLWSIRRLWLPRGWLKGSEIFYAISYHVDFIYSTYFVIHILANTKDLTRLVNRSSDI